MVFVPSTTIIAFIHELIATSRNPTLREFAEELHQRFYPDQDITYMDYFFELSAQENEGRFIVHHSKLIEYGVATSNRSSAMKDRLEVLELIEDEDWVLQDILQKSDQAAALLSSVFF